MKTIMKSLALLAVVACVGSAKADDSYLYWMVSEDYSSYPSLAGANLAKVKWSDGSTSGYLYNANPGAGANQDTFSNFTVAQFAQIGSTMLSGSYNFVVELYKDANLLGVTESLTSQQLAELGATGSDFFAITGEATFNVPEPTSGMLALLGFGLLALRRKQKKA